MTLKTLRKKNGLTQSDIAKKLDISESSVCLYEKKLRKPPLKHIQKLAEILGVTTDEIINCFN